MLLALFVQLLSRLLGWLEPYYVRWTRWPHSSLTLGFTRDVPCSKSDLLLENALLRQQLITLRVQPQVKKAHFTRRDRLSLLLLARQLVSGSRPI